MAIIHWNERVEDEGGFATNLVNSRLFHLPFFCLDYYFCLDPRLFPFGIVFYSPISIDVLSTRIILCTMIDARERGNGG